MAKTSPKILARMKKYYAGHRAERCEKQREYYKLTAVERRAYAATYRDENRNRLRVDQKEYRTARRPAMRELWNQRSRESQQRLRLEVLAQYGDKCACCAESAPEFLAIDHIHGGGNKHRKEVGRGGKFYVWLKRQGYPAGFTVLCHNCNLAKGFYGECPHKAQALVVFRRAAMRAV